MDHGHGMILNISNYLFFSLHAAIFVDWDRGKGISSHSLFWTLRNVGLFVLVCFFLDLFSFVLLVDWLLDFLFLLLFHVHWRGVLFTPLLFQLCTFWLPVSWVQLQWFRLFLMQSKGIGIWLIDFPTFSCHCLSHTINGIFFFPLFPFHFKIRNVTV